MLNPALLIGPPSARMDPLRDMSREPFSHEVIALKRGAEAEENKINVVVKINVIGIDAM